MRCPNPYFCFHSTTDHQCVWWQHLFNTSSLSPGLQPHHRRVPPLPPGRRDWSHCSWTSAEDPDPFYWLLAPAQPAAWKSCSEIKHTHTHKHDHWADSFPSSFCRQLFSRWTHLCDVVVGEGTCLKEIHPVSLGELQDRLPGHFQCFCETSESGTSLFFPPSR